MSEENTTQPSNVSPISGDGIIDNLLVRKDDPQPKAEDPKPSPVIYDSSARNRLVFTYYGGDEEIDVTHIYDPLTDERYMKFINGLDVHGTKDEIHERSREESVALWDDLVNETENIEYPADGDWKALIDNTDKIASLEQFLAVSTLRISTVAGGKLQLGASTDNQRYTTECWFNGRVATQTHVLTKATFERQKQFDRIEKKRIKQTPIRGLMKRSAEIKYVPQEVAIGELYDEMFVSAEGFANNTIPLRFKTAVMNFVFAAKVEQKHLGK